MEGNGDKISFKNELIRKSIHLSSSIVPVIYYFIDRKPAIIILAAFTITQMLLDILRVKFEPLKKLYLRYVKHILRGHELNNDKSVFTGATYLTLAFLICVIIFPKPVAITAMFVVVFCDSFAAIVGKSWGKHFISNKTFEGSLAFFLSGVIIILLTPKVTDSMSEYYVGIIAVFLSAIFELIPIKIDDNLSTPIFFGLVYLILIRILL